MAEPLDSNSTIISPGPITIPGYTTVQGNTVVGKDFSETVGRATRSAEERYRQSNGEFKPELATYSERTEFNNNGTYSSRVELTVRTFPEDDNSNIVRQPLNTSSNPFEDQQAANIVSQPSTQDFPNEFENQQAANINNQQTSQDFPNEFENQQAANLGNLSKPVKPLKDWRFRISLAPSSDYFYNIPIEDLAGTILEPLYGTDGVIFPYNPTINMSYGANYESTDLVHTNYKFHQYKNSDVGSITISADFTAQDTAEANYVLAMIHFFRSVTKMFYGNDISPPAGLPPPLCFLHGYGPYHFDNHPVVIQSFTYALPPDVDYIRARTLKNLEGDGQSPTKRSPISYIPGIDRLRQANINPGGVISAPKFKPLSNEEASYVPTKMTISLVCLPVMTRDDVSKNFSLKNYAKGTIYPKKANKSGGGFW